MLLNKNKHKRDERITFDEHTHTYFIDGDPEGYISVTTYIKSFFSKFNADNVINSMMAKSNWSDSKYNQGKSERETRKDIKALWLKTAKTACDKGTLLHKQIEDYFNDNNDDNITTDEYSQFLSFESDLNPYIPYRTEWTIFDDYYKIAGSIDFCTQNINMTDNKIHLSLYDWKCVKKLYTFSFKEWSNVSNKYVLKRGKKPLDLMDCNYYHYAMQLYLYKFILEKNYDVIVDDVNIIIFHKSNITYLDINVQDMTKYVKDILDERIKNINFLNQKDKNICKCKFKKNIS